MNVMKFSVYGMALLFATVASVASAVEGHEMKSVLLIGQSNMAGRGDFGEVPEIQHPRCFMMRNGRWVTMSEPINPDRPVFGS